MAPDLFRFNMLVIALLGVALLLLIYLVQRVYYCWRSTRCAQVERSRLSLRSDASVLGLALLFGVAGLSGIASARRLEDYQRAEPDDELLEFEVVEADARGLTLLVYPALARDYGVPQAERGMLVTPGTSFEVEVERIAFNPLLRGIGQASLGRVITIRGVFAQDVTSIGAGTPRSLELDASQPGLLDWLFYTTDERNRLVAPPTVRRGDIFAVRRNAEGYLELVAAPEHQP